MRTRFVERLPDLAEAPNTGDAGGVMFNLKKYYYCYIHVLVTFITYWQLTCKDSVKTVPSEEYKNVHRGQPGMFMVQVMNAKICVQA